MAALLGGIKSLLVGLKSWWLVIVLAAALGFMAYLDTVQSQRDKARQQHATAQAALDVTVATLAVEVEKNRLLVVALEEREQELNQGAQRIDQLRAQANALGADDANSDNRQWSNERVPSSVSQWVRILTTPGDAGADGLRAAGVPD